jgi:hypothetical protein
VKKAGRVWLGAHDTPSDMQGIATRTMEIFGYCISHKIEMSVVTTLVCACDMITGGHFVCYNLFSLIVFIGKHVPLQNSNTTCYKFSFAISSNSGDRNLVGARFFAHVQTGPGAHPASCTMGTGCFPGVKQAGSGADHPPLPSAEVENE